MSFLCHIATAVPQQTISTKQMADFVADEFCDNPVAARKFNLLTRDRSIANKHIAIPDFILPRAERRLYVHADKEPTTAERMRIYEQEALPLALKATHQLLQDTGLQKEKITHIIFVSCTGMVAPGMECRISEHLGLRSDIQRYAVNFMGCYAAFQGLKIADMIAQTQKDAEVLLVLTELCSLHFRRDSSDDNLLSTFLFSDGAAAAWIRGAKPEGKALEMKNFSSYLLNDSKLEMGWYLRDLGFEMVLKREIPKRIENNIREVFLNLLNKCQINENQIDTYAIHPGGKSILTAFEKALNLDFEALNKSYDILQKNGNMSSVTIMFVLSACLNDENLKENSYIYAAAFGPGLTVEQAVLKTTSS